MVDMMECVKFQELLADLDRPGVLPAELRESAFAHAKACGDCGDLLSETELLGAELRRLAAFEEDSQVPARLEAQLLNALRQRNSMAERKTAWRYASAIGIAAVLLLALGFWLNHGTTSKKGLPGLRVRKPVVAMAPGTQGSNRTSPGSAHTNAREGAARQPAAMAKRRDANAEALSSEPDAAAGFIPLPDADPGPLDDGAVVRVEMPRAALASFGLPVEAMEGGGTVGADLIVSADGTPQAIRLVSQNDAAAEQ